MFYKHITKPYIVRLLFGVALYIVYVSMSDIYPLLPPLIGILFVIFHKFNNLQQTYIPIFIVFCIFFYELDKSLIIGIIPCVFFIVHIFVAQQLESLLHVNSFFIIVYVVALYLFYLAGMILCNILLNTPVLEFSFIYVYYMIIDSILALVYYFIFIRD
ncbi:hypothetical protein CQA53_02185 [Helicobacter didelphidarum]|uniref:Rod shape-determining protein MreD n=1 Tax=Helicobacter didelphidarum TaxID=2040648 RepID=A0A3D8IP68_9HELI|nr:hypothetical protein [Helicobacter didelphidarum]RDU67087.1 hypothetical protein CQA53_02185 [Helicobacter didelphidarum]